MGDTDFSGFTLYTTFEPYPMCCGAILASGVSTLVLGARFSDGSSQWGDYALEKLLEMTGRGGQLRVVTGVFLEQQYLIRAREPAACFRAFLNNNWMGTVVYAGIVTDYHWI